MQRRSSSDWSNLGSDYEEARKKANQSIINVKQFFPQLHGGIKIVKDKLSYLGHNSEDTAAKKFSTRTASTVSKASGLQPTQEQAEGGEGEETERVFATEVQAGRSDEWLADRKRKLHSMQELVDTAVAEHYQAAMQAMKSGDSDTALHKLHKCIVLQPNQSDFYAKRAEILVNQSDLKSAIANYRFCLRLCPENRDYWERLAFLYLLTGQILFDQGFHAEALESFAKAAEMRPESVAYQTRCIACLTALGRQHECLALVNRRIEAGGDSSADLLVMRARLHCLFGSHTLAYYDVVDALGLQPRHSAAAELHERLLATAKDLGKQAVELALNGRLRDAVKKLNIAIDMDPSVAGFHVRRAALQRRLGDFGAAVDDCLQALDKCDHDPTSSVYINAQKQLLLTFNDFGVECFTKGFFEESVGLLDKAIKAEKSQAALYINRGDCFYQLGQLHFAQRDYEQAAELNESDTSVPLRLSLTHHRLGQDAFQAKRFDESIASFSEAIRQQPRQPQLWFARGRSKYFAGGDQQLQEARADLAAALLLGLQLDEAARTLLSRLFVGEAPEQLLEASPQLRRRAEKAISQFLAEGELLPRRRMGRSEEEEEEVAGESAARRRRRATSRRSVGGGGVSIPSAAECADERQMHRRLLRQKFKASRAVQQLLKQPPPPIPPLRALPSLNS